MRRSIRSSLFLLVAPFALTFTLIAWVVSSKIGPWLAQPVVASCEDKGYSQWFCSVQDGLLVWVALGLGILILLTVTASLSLAVFRAHLKELQKDVLDFQKGHRGNLAPDAPWEMGPLIQLLNRILKAGAERSPQQPISYPPHGADPMDRQPGQPMATRERAPSEPVFPHSERPAPHRAPEPPPRPAPSPRPTAYEQPTHHEPAVQETAYHEPEQRPPEPRQPPQRPPEPPRRQEPAQPRAASRPPEPPPARQTPPPVDAKGPEDMEITLEQLDADLDTAFSEPEPPAMPEREPEPEPEPAPQPESRRRPAPEPEPEPEPQTNSAQSTPHRSDDRPEARHREDSEQDHSGTQNKKNLAYPARKCRKLIAMLGQRYPNVNFDLITEVAESDPWTIREAELTEVFGQLLDNAGKWAESQANIFLAIKGNMLVFGVADDGPGVDPEIAPHLGEEEFQASPERDMGDGLVTVRRVLDTHGGSLAFDRSRLGGLEVIAAIPGSPVPRHVSAKGAYQ